VADAPPSVRLTLPAVLSGLIVAVIAPIEPSLRALSSPRSMRRPARAGAPAPSARRAAGRPDRGTRPPPWSPGGARLTPGSRRRPAHTASTNAPACVLGPGPPCAKGTERRSAAGRQLSPPAKNAGRQPSCFAQATRSAHAAGQVQHSPASRSAEAVVAASTVTASTAARSARQRGSCVVAIVQAFPADVQAEPGAASHKGSRGSLGLLALLCLAC